MKKVRRVDFFPDELIAGTAGRMTPTVFGIYWMVCTLIYSKGTAIDDDPKWLANLFGGTNRRSVATALAQLEQDGKIERANGKLWVKRCLSELERTAKRIDSARENGATGGRPRRRVNGLANPDGLDPEKTNHQPATPNHQRKGPVGNLNAPGRKGEAEKPPSDARNGRAVGENEEPGASAGSDEGGAVTKTRDGAVLSPEQVQHQIVLRLRATRYADKASLPIVVADLVDHGAEPMALLTVAGECALANLKFEEFMTRARRLLPGAIQETIEELTDDSHGFTRAAGKGSTEERTRGGVVAAADAAKTMLRRP